MTKIEGQILEQAKIVAEIYQTPWSREYVNAIEDFWSIAQDDLQIPKDKQTILPDWVVDQLPKD